MKYSDLVNNLLICTEGRVKVKAKNKLEEYGEKGLARSSIAVTGSFSIIHEELIYEIPILLSELSKLKLTNQKIVYLNRSINDFITRVYIEHQNYLEQINVFKFSENEQFANLIKNGITNLQTISELKLQIIMKAKSDQQKKVIWDIGKMILSAIVGGVIGAYIKKYL